VNPEQQSHPPDLSATVGAVEFRHTIILAPGIDRFFDCNLMLHPRSIFLEHLLPVHEVRKAARERPSSLGRAPGERLPPIVAVVIRQVPDG
jgi:hypothetical protein